MATKGTKIFGSLYWRISLIFFLVLSIMAGVYFLIIRSTVEMYYQETAQNVNRPVAERIAKEPFLFVDGSMEEKARDSVFHWAMVLNPALEVYVLDTGGKILDYNAPDEIIKLETVNLRPVKAFIRDTSSGFFSGDDPRHPELQKTFTAAPVKEGDKTVGYVYIVLQSDKYTSVTDRIAGSYFLGVGVRSMILVLGGALLIAMIILWFLTRNLKQIVRVVRQFRKGEHSARIELKSRGELTGLANDFNEMADTIVKYINEIKSVEQLRRELIANVSHDLRTPLAAIQGYAETLVMKHETMPENEKLRYTNIILSSTEKIRKLVDQLFELSKLEAMQVQAQFEPFSLAELVYDNVAKYQILAEQKNIALETKIPHHLPMITADIALMDRVLQNLIDNALKHTPEGGKITITLRIQFDGNFAT
ncbi:MAG: histidine kinase dimerization/phospho-acceptor domain-containing protein, partial [Bacteroidota bacterium]